MATDARTPSSGPETGDGTVLIVDDEPYLVGVYAAALEDTYTVKTATSGEAALGRLDGDVDVVLLDRRMPGLCGSDVLETIREEGYDCRVAMVTAVDPDVDIVEMEFDTYVVKPVRIRDLHELVENLLLRSQYREGVQDLFAVTSKLVALESRFSNEELTGHEEYQELHEHREYLEAVNQERLAELMDRGDSGLVFRDILEGVENR